MSHHEFKDFAHRVPRTDWSLYANRIMPAPSSLYLMERDDIISILLRIASFAKDLEDEYCRVLNSRANYKKKYLKLKTAKLTRRRK